MTCFLYSRRISQQGDALGYLVHINRSRSSIGEVIVDVSITSESVGISVHRFFTGAGTSICFGRRIWQGLLNYRFLRAQGTSIFFLSKEYTFFIARGWPRAHAYVLGGKRSTRNDRKKS